MFGALNRFISRLDSDSPSQSYGDSYGTFGFQVLRNKNQDIPIDPWYDFIVEINGRPIDDPDPNLFATEIRNCAGSAVTLTTWSAKGSQTRALRLPVPSSPPSLGLTLQWNPVSTTYNVWHILDVSPNSPADIAGLLPYGDYIVGTPEGIVHGESGLGELVEDYLSRPLRLYVYNHEYSVTRLVTIIPSRNWGGNGALGCMLGFGALHRLPAPLNEPPAAPGETLFETARLSYEESRPSSTKPPSSNQFYPPSTTSPSSDLLVPALLPTAPSRLATSTASSRIAKKTRQAVSPNRAFDELFQESEKKSKEENFVPKSSATPPPPPPKMGSGPPRAGSLEHEKLAETAV